MSEEKKINVLQLVEGFSLGGAEKKLWELIAKMDRSKYRTVVCSLGLGDTIQEYFEKLDVKVVTLTRKSKFDLSLIWRLRALIREEKIDVIMTTLFYADFLGALVGKWAGAKAVFSWETISSPKWLVWHRLYSYRAAIKLADRVISVSQATAEWLREKRGVAARQIEVIPYGVDLDMFQAKPEPDLKQELGLSSEQPVVGMVGRLNEQKGHVYLIDAAEIVVKKVPNVRFLLVGDGPLRQELEEKVASKGLQDNFIFLGFRHDVPRLLRIFDIFTLPSLYEGLPNVVLEAMAVNLPVVATPVDGTKEAVVQDETGLLIPEKNPGALADALIELLTDKEKAVEMGNNGRRRVEQEFSLQKQVSSFEDIYAEWAKK